MASGEPQPDDSFREMTVFDGDDFSGERCELGRNEYRYGEDGDGRHLRPLPGGSAQDHVLRRCGIGESLPADGADWQTLDADEAGAAGRSTATAARSSRSSSATETSSPVPAGSRSGRCRRPAGSGCASRWTPPTRAAADQGAPCRCSSTRTGTGTRATTGEQSPVYAGATLKGEVEPGSASPESVKAGRADSISPADRRLPQPRLRLPERLLGRRRQRPGRRRQLIRPSATRDAGGETPH